MVVLVSVHPLQEEVTVALATADRRTTALPKGNTAAGRRHTDTEYSAAKPWSLWLRW